jgi:large subunit ribosomal protein L12
MNMKDVYAALLLHSAGQPINEANVSKVLGAAGITEEAAKVKALVAALDGVNIEEACAKAALAAAPAASTEAKKEDKKPEVTEEKKEEEAAAGLASLFG